MNVVLVLSVVIALASAVPVIDDDSNGKIHIPDKCSDVLAVNVCDKLTEMAKRLKLNADQVKTAVVEAVKKGKTKSIDIYNFAKDYLINEVMSKKCEDFTTMDNCDRMRKIAGLLKVNANKMKLFVIQAVAEGNVRAQEIYNKVVEYYKKEIATKKCEDFLTIAQCQTLRGIAGRLKIKGDKFEEATREAYIKRLGDAKQMYQQTIEVLKDYALNTKCEDLLNPDLCAALRKYAQITKVQFPVLMDKAVDMLINGYNVGKDMLKQIFKLVDHFYDCEDVFDKPSCDRLRKLADTFGIAHSKLEEFIKTNVPKAIETGKDIFNNFPEMLKSFSQYLKEQWCKVTPFC